MGSVTFHSGFSPFPVCKILEVRTTPSSAVDLFGAVSDGHLRVRGQFLKLDMATLDMARKEDERDPPTITVDAEPAVPALLGASGSRDEKPRLLVKIVDPAIDVDDDIDLCSISLSRTHGDTWADWVDPLSGLALLFFLVGFRTASSFVHDAGGLVLLPVAGEKGTWRRVGMFTIRQQSSGLELFPLKALDREKDVASWYPVVDDLHADFFEKNDGDGNYTIQII